MVVVGVTGLLVVFEAVVLVLVGLAVGAHRGAVGSGLCGGGVSRGCRLGACIMTAACELAHIMSYMAESSLLLFGVDGVLEGCVIGVSGELSSLLGSQSGGW